MKAKNRWLVGLAFGLIAFAALLFPIGLFIIQHKEQYFAVDTSGDMFMGLIVALIVAVLITTRALKNLEPNITVLMSLGAAWAFFYFVQVMLADLPALLLRALIGYALFIPLFRIAKRQMAYYRAYKDERMRVQARASAEV